MLAPILFVDEKKVEGTFEYRFRELKNQLEDCEDIIEFISDLEIKHSVDPYTDFVMIQPNPYLQSRKIIFVHVSQDSPIYNEPLYNALKASQHNTLFARFSGQGSLNTNRESLRFQRHEHIYNMQTKGFQLAIRFYKQSNLFEPYILVYGKQAFSKKIEKAESEIQWIERNITNQTQLQQHRGNRHFENIMYLADLDTTRIEKGREYMKTINSYTDYVDIMRKYAQQAKDISRLNNELLKSLIV
ncbi:hypothetical protein [Fibrella aquatilis]|uniref:Uncharacterized protein n=1 Tax=Fibrella aquatilis TaxID=2817059 RepID=A0A939G621_9BACT|nr:hypothetical protein [Fibrella aquatilis]MBO0932551.1 hypothetical protein [Fibrella aquatilis]